MKTYEFFDNPSFGRLTMSGNPLVESDLLPGDHMTGYGRHFIK